MTLYHFVNCLLLTFAPPVILYRFSVLSEYGTIWRPAIGALAYMVTQMGKMLIIAGLVNLGPFWDRFIDCMGMYYFLVNHHKASVASVKILNMALGWSLAESLFTRLVNFYINARSLQFDWSHLAEATEANIALAQNVCICALLWYWNRKSHKTYLILILGYLVLVSTLQPALWGRIAILMGFSISSMVVLNLNLSTS